MLVVNHILDDFSAMYEAFVTEYQDCRYSNYIEEVLMHNLAKELSSFVEIDTCTNPMEGTITYRARIKVAKPNN